jgi:hypothetical protein
LGVGGAVWRDLPYSRLVLLEANVSRDGNNWRRVVTALIIGIGAGVIVGSLLTYFTGYDAIGVGAGVVVGAGLTLRL